MRTIVLQLTLLLWSSLGLHAQSAPHAMDAIPVADVHVHLLDFLQNGGYLKDGTERVPKAGDVLPSGSRHFRLLLLLQKMDECNVSHAMVSGMPFVKKWSEDESFRSTYYLSSSSHVTRARDTDYIIALAFEDFRSREPERFQKEFHRLYPFICGFNGTDLGAVDMIVKRIKEFPGTWKGIGEVMSRHDDLTNLTEGERPRADHPALLRVYDFAGEHGLPVSIHHNVAPISHDGIDHQTRYIDELLRSFDAFPKTQFIWCHAGSSRRIVVDDLTDIIDRQVLARHKDHVCIDLSWVVFENYLLQ
ncbi:MAG TPA: amidohydrolase family protein, partial [Planctomycetaceae bacterium]|nr:amidohydrolase family protein [Planctomycetaceae bacterium]